MRKVPGAFLLLAVFLLSSVAFALSVTAHTQSLRDALQGLVGVAAIVLIFAAAAIYAVGQVFGADLRARTVVWSTGIFSAVIVGVILFVIFSTFIDVVEGNGVFGINGEELHFIVLALGMGASMTVLIYFAGGFFQHAPLQAIAKEEVAALFFTVVILLSWGMANSALSGVARGVLCSGNTDLCAAGGGALLASFGSHADIAYGSLQVLFTKMKAFYTHLYLFEILIGFLSTITFPLGSPLPAVNLLTFSFAPYTGLTMISNAHTVIVEAIGYMITFIIAKQFILDFARLAVPTILFPLGLGMRAFPFLRTTGSSIIAASIVLYFIYPSAILLTNYLIFDVYKPADFVYVPKVSDLFSGTNYDKFKLEAEKSQARSNDLLKGFQDNSKLVEDQVRDNQYRGFFGTIGNFLSSVWDKIKGFFGTVFTIARTMFGLGGDLISNIFFSLSPTGAAGGLYRFIIEEVINIGQFMALMLIGSFVEFVITITMYRNIAALIGGEVEIAGLSKLV